MRVATIGGGPGGLYAALLLKKNHPDWQIAVYERNRPTDTYGWGVVFSDQTMDNLAEADRPSHDAILDSFYHWDDIEVFFKGRMIRSGGHGFSGLGRMRLLNILQTRCAELGVDLHFQCDLADESPVADADLIIAADGANSRVRTKYAEFFQPKITPRKCKYIWLGTHKQFEAFTFAFEETQWGWFQLHAYRFDQDTSTVIVETPEENWHSAGLDEMSADESIHFCERLFAPYLDGNALISNASHLKSPWLNFWHVLNEHWLHKNILLLGDAAHTAHFSIGSGTKLALEDAITLDRVLMEHDDLLLALREYEAVRKVETFRIQNAARNSTEWFENVKRYTAFEAEQFAYSLLTRSQRVSHENLRLRDQAYLEQYEAWFAHQDGLPEKPIPPMFTPFRLRDVTVPNRVVMSPMAMYSAEDGTVNDFHFIHFGSRAHGGAGLIFTEMTCPSPDARITPGCAGMYKDEHKAAYKRIVDYVHAQSQAKFALQLGHAGPKGSTQVGWEDENEPLIEGNWPLIAASAVAYGKSNQIPRAMTLDDMVRVKADFVRAAQWGDEIGFDWLELHCAHGYLFSSFISPLTNLRDDAYGGSLEKRCRYPLEVFAAMRAVWPQSKPMSVRISAHDWVEGGNTPEDAVEIARLFKAAGADLIDVSSGQTTRRARPIYGRMYQTPFADQIRNEIGIATMAVGAITEPDHVNSIIASGRADLCALARPHLSDPYWTLRAAAQIGYKDVAWPKQYLPGKAQLERLMDRAANRE
ncbi:MAG TPA: bifunctional salicylyl-CoA 5-hydroxylase/oxidoreductase [Phototrophicaceae bacterium]|nr:bifunctional salicylyl-CoA 5-hydroxylase/oxidoreductase [Phototrophicaceae bacterium]